VGPRFWHPIISGSGSESECQARVPSTQHIELPVAPPFLKVI
jgi:hypothetical protein